MNKYEYEGGNQEKLMNSLKCKADVVISVNPLTTGYSKEIHGQV